MSTILVNSYDGGTNGTPLTGGAGGNTGGVSGNFFDTISIGSGATCAFDSTHAATGPLSCKIATGASAASYMYWGASLGAGNSQVWFRQYLYITGVPAANFRVVTFWNSTSATTLCGSVVIRASGKIAFWNSTAAEVLITTTSFPLNAWFRIEGYLVGSATVGQMELKLFLSPNSAAPTETQTSAASQNTAGTVGSAGFGLSSSVPSVGPFWMDSPGVSTAGYLGPVSSGGIAVGTTPVLLGSCPPGSSPVPLGELTLFNGGTPIFLGGGSGVTASNGAQVAAAAAFKAHLFSADQIWACTASGTSTVTILQTGA